MSPLAANRRSDMAALLGNVQPSVLDIVRTPLPYMRDSLFDRVLCKSVASIARDRILSIQGLEHVQPDRDPFILALNHSQKLESVIIPTTLFLYRSGKVIHFLADWNFLLIPVIGTLLKRGKTIIVGRKPARPKILNMLKPLLTDSEPPYQKAKRLLRSGSSVGIFPEGTVNKNPEVLRTGSLGAARMSMETGVPVVVGGIRFPQHNKELPISEREPLAINIGAPISPPSRPEGTRLDHQEVTAWHAQIMRRMAMLSGKEWNN